MFAAYATSSGRALVDRELSLPKARASDRNRCRAAKLHADQGHDYDHLRQWLPKRGIRHRIAAKGSSPPSGSAATDGLWRTAPWLAGCRRLHRRCERKAEHVLAFAGIAAALMCHHRLVRADGPHQSV